MTRNEANKAMREGKKVTHVYFSPEEWATMENGMVVLEDGVRCDPFEFWTYRMTKEFETGWSLFNEQ